jgi:hypothetical protein
MDAAIVDGRQFMRTTSLKIRRLRFLKGCGYRCGHLIYTQVSGCQGENILERFLTKLGLLVPLGFLLHIVILQEAPCC